MTKPRLVMMRDAVMGAGLAMLIGMASANVKAAEVGDSPPSWQGLWVAAGTPFALRLEQSAPGEAIGLRQGQRACRAAELHTRIHGCLRFKQRTAGAVPAAELSASPHPLPERF